MLDIGFLVPYLGFHPDADLKEGALELPIQHVYVLLHPLEIRQIDEKRLKMGERKN